MILSRRSFLKVAGLTVAAAASASMFTGCNAALTTPVEYEAAAVYANDENLKKVITALNKDPFANSVLGNSDVNKGDKTEKFQKLISDRKTIDGVKTSNIIVDSAELALKSAEDAKDGKSYYYIKVVLSLDGKG